jgi:hypothetical protein
MGYDARREFFARQPIEDYYFAGVVAMEAVRIRNLFSVEETDAIMGEIGAQVDTAAGRYDRIVSEMVFDLVSRIHMATGADLLKMPYDRVTEAVLQAIGIHENEQTEPLMHDKIFRHALGEPLAVGFRNWWAEFQEEFVIFIPDEPEDADADKAAHKPWRAKRAATF